jgi:tetratricopeptide (TPR) repeat protein
LRLSRDRTYSDYYYARGLSYQSKGELDLALADFSQAIRLDFAHPRAYVARASIFKAKGDLSSALADCNKAYQFRENYPTHGW